MSYNSQQEDAEREREKPNIKKARIAQNKYEKGKIFAPVFGAIQNKRVLTKPCPECKSTNVEKVDFYFHCKKCDTNYTFDRFLGVIKLPKKIKA